MSVRQTEAETFTLALGALPFDLVFAVRAGALDGRHPAAGRAVLARVRSSSAPGGRVFVDGGDPVRELHLFS